MPLLLQAGLDANLIAEKLSINPRAILNLPIATLKVGEKANFVVYHPAKKWEYNTLNNASKSKNSPLLGKTLTGKVELVYNNNQFQKYE